MRLGIFCIIGLLLGVNLASSQTPKTASPSPSPKPTLPEFRPALIGTGPDSLINRIDTADLIKKGQKDGAVMFSCLGAYWRHRSQWRLSWHGGIGAARAGTIETSRE